MVHCRVFVIFTLGLSLVGCGQSSMEPEAVAQPTSRVFAADQSTTLTPDVISVDIVLLIPIDAEEISKAFGEDATDAYEKYVGKLFVISGEVLDITDDDLLMYGHKDYGTPDIRCYYVDSAPESVVNAAYNHQNALAVVGTVRGMKENNIIVQDCRAGEGMNTVSPTPTPISPTSRPTRTSQVSPTPRPICASQVRAEIGKPAPEFTLKVYENDNYTKDQEVRLSDLCGKPVVINFWFPECTQCQDLMFLLKNSYNQNKDDVHFVAIQVSAESKSAWDPGGSDAASGQDYVTDKKLHFIVGGDLDRSIATSYGVDAYPTTYFLDKELNLVSSAEYLRAKQIRDNIELASK